MASVHARGSATASGTKGLRERPVIAVIDDDESVRNALASLLRSTGLAVVTFAGAHEFLRSPGWPKWLA